MIPAQSAGLITPQTAPSPALMGEQPKPYKKGEFEKLFAQKIFGSHLFLQNQKVVFTPLKQWAAVKAARAKVGKVPLSCILECLDSEGRTYFTTNG